MQNNTKNLKDYPDVMNMEQMRAVCHISKRTAQYLLRFNLIPHTCTNKKTHKYSIKKSDIIYFIKDRKAHPGKYAAPDKWYVNGEVDEKAYYKSLQPRPPKEKELFRQYYEEMLSEVSDVVSVTDVMAITGYSRGAILRWIHGGKLRTLRLLQKYMVPKVYLLDWLCSDKYNKMQKKSQEHINALWDIQERFGKSE